MVAPAMADQATADQATVDPGTETVDLSVEEAFFERAGLSSDRPVWFDTELPEPSPDARLIAHEPEGLVYVVRYWVPSFAQEIDCRYPGIKGLVLRAEFVKKA